MVPLQIVTVVAGLIAFVAKILYPAFPLTTDQIVLIITTLLGLFGVVVQLRNQAKIRKLDSNGGNVVLNSKAFWLMVASIVSLVVTSYFPDFPIAQVDVGTVLLWLVTQVGLNPQLRAQGLIK